MRKVFEPQDYDYEIQEALKLLLDVSRLPRIIIIETVEENE